MINDELDIPDFLKVANRPPCVDKRTRKLSIKEKRRNWRRPATWSAEAEALAKTIERETAEKREARFAALRERR